MTNKITMRLSLCPSLEEDAIINAQIAADPDDREWTDEDFANALTYKELLAEYPELAAFDHHKAKEALKRPEREKVRRRA